MKNKCCYFVFDNIHCFMGCHNETRRNSYDNGDSSNIKEYFNNDGAKVAVYTDNAKGRSLWMEFINELLHRGEIVEESYTNGMLDGDRKVYRAKMKG